MAGALRDLRHHLVYDLLTCIFQRRKLRPREAKRFPLVQSFLTLSPALLIFGAIHSFFGGGRGGGGGEGEGLSSVLQVVEQHPQPLPTRSQEHFPSLTTKNISRPKWHCEMSPCKPQLPPAENHSSRTNIQSETSNWPPASKATAHLQHHNSLRGQDQCLPFDGGNLKRKTGRILNSTEMPWLQQRGS